MTPGLLNGEQLRKALGLKPRTFYTHLKRKAFTHLEVKRPVGQFRYSAQLVEVYLAGESTVTFGKKPWSKAS